MRRRGLWLAMTAVLATAMLPAAGWLFAEDGPEPTGPEAGLALAAQLRNIRPDDGEWQGSLKIQRHGPKGRTTTVLPVAGKAESTDAHWSVTYRVEPAAGRPAEGLTVAHSVDGPNEYVYARGGTNEPLRLTGSGAEIPLADSDYWLADLGFEFYHWPQQNRLKGAMRQGRPCYVLESTDPGAKPGGYGRVVSWIDRETGGPIEAEAYGSDGKRLKEFAIGSVKKVNGRYQLKDMSIINVRTSSRTTMEFDLTQAGR